MIEGNEFASMSLEEIIRKSQGPVFNNAAQVWNHTFFWNCMKPSGGGEPISHRPWQHVPGRTKTADSYGRQTVGL